MYWVSRLVEMMVRIRVLRPFTLIRNSNQLALGMLERRSDVCRVLYEGFVDEDSSLKIIKAAKVFGCKM